MSDRVTLSSSVTLDVTMLQLCHNKNAAAFTVTMVTDKWSQNLINQVNGAVEKKTLTPKNTPKTRNKAENKDRIMTSYIFPQ